MKLAPMMLVTLLVLSSIVPLATLAAPASVDGEDRQAEGPLGPEDAMVQYAILTSFSFVEQFERLAEWKTDKGVYAKVYPTDWVTNNYQGSDSRAQYHAFLRDLYNHTGGGLRYLLIGGDHEVIRSQKLFTGIKVGWEPYSGEWVYSDHFYAGLDHDWDADGDGRYGELGETDWEAEIAVGRAPVSTVAQVTDVVDKLLAYEKDPEVGDWMRTAVLVSSVMNPPNANITNAHRPSDIYKWWEDNAWESLTRTFPLIPEHMDQHVLYDYNQIEGGNYTPENDTLNRSSYIAALDMGSSIFVSVTHGWIPTGNGIPHYVGDGIGFNWSTAFYYTNIPGLSNGNRTPFAYFSSCYVGNFTELNDTNFEQLFTMRYGGTIGFIAPSENTYRGEENPGSSDGNWWMSENFWRHMLTGEPRPGDAFYRMIGEYEPHLRDVGANPDSPYFRQNHAAYNLVGDPEMPIWLDVPRDLQVELPSGVYDLEYDVPVRVTDGTYPVDGARVAFRGEDFYAFADSGEDGWAYVHVDPKMEGQSVKVTTTCPGFLPDEQTLGIAPAPAELTVTAHTIRASTMRPRAGSPTEVSAEVRNLGHNDALSFSVQFYDGDPSLDKPIDAAVDVPGLPALTSATISATWASPEEGLHDVYVVVDSEDEVAEVLEDNNVRSGRVFVSAINGRVASLRVEGDGTSTALPFNQESTIVVTIESPGPGDLPSAGVRLYLGDPSAGGRPVGSDRFVSSVPAGGSQEASFPFVPTQLGSFKLFAVVDPDDELMEYNEGDNSASMDVSVGHPPIWDTIPDVLMVEDYDKVFDLTRYLTDFDTEMADLEVSLVSIGTNMVNVTLDGKVVFIEPKPDWAGTFDVGLEVTDGAFVTATGFNVLVEPRNDPPRFRNTGNIMTLREGERFYYVFDAVDPDGEEVTFTDNSGLFDIAPDGVIDYTPTFEDISAGLIHVFRVIASDGTDQSFYPMTLEFELDNTPPVMHLPEELILVAGEPFALDVAAHDREGDILTFSSENELFEIIAGTGQIRFTPSQGMVGEHNVSITVTDGEQEVTRHVILYIYDAEPEERDTTTSTKAVLAGELALIVVGMLYIFNFRRRIQRERVASEEQDT